MQPRSLTKDFRNDDDREPGKNGGSVEVGNDIKAQAQLIAPAPMALRTSLTPPVVTASQTTFCAGTTAILQTNATGNLQWFRDGVAITGAVSAALNAVATGDYQVQVSYCDTTLRSAAVYLDVVQLPRTQILQVGDTLVTDEGIAYQWYLNDQPLEGEVSRTLVPRRNGTYRVEVIRPCGSEQSEPYNYYTTAVAQAPSLSSFEVYPNPYQVATGIHYTLPMAGPVLIEVYNTVGAKVATLVDAMVPAGAHTTAFGAARYRQGGGCYLIRFTYQGATTTRRILEIR